MSIAMLVRGLSTLLAPQRCLGCDMPTVTSRVAFCEACEPLLEVCAGRLLPPHVTAAYQYGGPLADAIQRFKYGRRPELAGGLARLLRERAFELAGIADCVVPMPLHPRRLRERGYHQVALLCRPLARQMAIDVDALSLRRLRDTPAQAGLAKQQRLVNVRAAFACAPSLSQRRVLLVDDVRTTGASLEAAREALLNAGCAEVHCLVLAQADHFQDLPPP